MNQITPVTSLNLSSPYLSSSSLMPTAGNGSSLQTLGAATTQLASLGGVQPAGATNTLGASFNPTAFMGMPAPIAPPASAAAGTATTSNPDLNGLLASVGSVTTAPLTAAPAPTAAATPTTAAAAPVAGVNALANPNPTATTTPIAANPAMAGINNPELNGLLNTVNQAQADTTAMVNTLLIQNEYPAYQKAGFKGTPQEFTALFNNDATKPGWSLKNALAFSALKNNVATSNPTSIMASQILPATQNSVVQKVASAYGRNGGDYTKAAASITKAEMDIIGLTPDQLKAKVLATAKETATTTTPEEAAAQAKTTTVAEAKTTQETKPAKTSVKSTTDSTATTAKLKGTNTEVKVM